MRVERPKNGGGEVHQVALTTDNSDATQRTNELIITKCFDAMTIKILLAIVCTFLAV